MNDEFNPEEIMAELENENFSVKPENYETEETEETEESKKSNFHDGIGLNFAEIKNIVALQHSTILSEDDPILIFISIYNAYLTESEKLLKKHNKALTEILSLKTKQHIEAIEKVSNSLTETLTDSSINAIHNVFNKHGEKLEKFKTTLFWASLIVSTAAIINLIFYFLGD